VRSRYVIDANRITCTGAMATFDLVSALIGRDHGPLLAMEVAQVLMTENYSHGPAKTLRAESSLVNRALKVMQAHLETPLPIATIARQIGCSQKILETRVQTEMQTTPQALYRRLRLNLARKLAAETDQSVAEIASRCGYDNASAMTRAFKAEFGETPRDVRRQS
jgi:transcriptional regulator GlxA family with amidase domain